jgi:nifR3 family TIM-barrel protein
MKTNKPYIYLAPMAGISDKTMRRLCKEKGADFTVSEMISAKAVYYKDKKTFSLASIDKDEHPCVIQLFGSEPDTMAYAAEKMLEFSPDAIDINMGCPVGKIVSNGEGSALMKEPTLAGEITKAVKNAVSVPVTVKFRLGYDEEHINCVEFAKILEDSGADALCVHGRTRAQMYSGRANWDMIAKVKDAVRVPVFANGDVFTPEDCADILEKTKCDGVAVARGALGNPFIFKQIKELLETGSYTQVTDYERLSLAMRHVDMLVKDKGEYTGIREARKHLGWYTKGLYGSAEARDKINAATTLVQMREIIEVLMEKA